MSDFLIYTDSAADLSLEYTEKNNIRVIPFYITFDGNTYFKEDIELTKTEFYGRLSEGIIPKTSCPSVSDYADAFKYALNMDKKVICICLSSKLSGSYQSAVIASKEFNEKERRVFVVDSLLATAAQGLLVNEAVGMKDDGLDIQTVFEKLNEIKTTGIINFVIDDLTYLHKGGRIGKVSALMGTLLNVKPVIMLKEGELFPLAKIRSRKKAAEYIKKLAKAVIEEKGDSYAYSILSCAGDADDFAPGVNLAVPAFLIGSTIASHTGSSAAGIAYIKRYK